MTYSIVGRDPETGELGVAVQSRAFNTGAACAWAEAGVGAVATQSFTERRYGPRGLALLAAGQRPREALDELLEADEGRGIRQVAFVDTARHDRSAYRRELHPPCRPPGRGERERAGEHAPLGRGLAGDA